jgi:hypothetical protein
VAPRLSWSAVTGNASTRRADTLLWLASEPAERLNSGGYYVKRQLRVPGGPAGDAELAARLWAASAKAVGV